MEIKLDFNKHPAPTAKRYVGTVKRDEHTQGNYNDVFELRNDGNYHYVGTIKSGFLVKKVDKRPFSPKEIGSDLYNRYLREYTIPKNQSYNSPAVNKIDFKR